MRTLTKKSPARRNHAVLAYADENTAWTIDSMFFDETVPCTKLVYKCVSSSEYDDDICTENDLCMDDTCNGVYTCP